MTGFLVLGEPVPGFDGFRQVLLSKKPGCGHQGSGLRRLRARGFEGLRVGGFRWVRFCLDGTGSGNRVPGTKGIEKVPGSRDSDPKVPKVTLYFDCPLKVYFVN